MRNQVRTTKIEKKWKDKQTGKERSITIDYAKVADRLKAFREANPNSKITTKAHHMSDGSVIFKAYVWRNKDEFFELLKSGVKGADALESADSEGTTMADGAKIRSEKGFEKQETIAIGRALALLGYAMSGEIASTEEMEEFEDYKKQKMLEARQGALDSLENARSIEELKKTFATLPRELWSDKEVVAKKDEMKKKLSGEKGEVTNENPQH